MMFKPVVVAPTYNNARTLPDVLVRLDAVGSDVLVVNDGSTDGTAEILAGWLASRPSGHAHVVIHARNRGKATALRTGFADAKALGYTHALTIDTDGQLSPEQVPDFFAAAQANPESLVLGVRDDSSPDYPGKSRLGRRVANLLVWMESGLRVADSQCGLRVYPLSMEGLQRCRAGRYGFETEIIVRAGWEGRDIVELPAKCVYFKGTERVTHFRPWRDSIRQTMMHARLVGQTLIPICHGRRFQHDSTTAGIKTGGSIWRQVLRWLSPMEAWRQLRADRPDGSRRTAMAGAIAIGSFIGCLPIYGLHAFLGLYCARRLNLNPVAIVLGTQVACPPLGIVLATMSTAIGSIIMEGGIPPLSRFAPVWQHWYGIFEIGPWFFVNWFIGSVVVGALCLVAMFFISDWLFRRVPAEKAASGDVGPTDTPNLAKA